MTAFVSPERRVVVLGLGNLMRTDDAVGMLAASALASDARLPAGVEVVEGGTLGLDLLGLLYGATHLVALDAVDFGAAPGTLGRFEGTALAQLPTSKSVHLLGLSDLLNVMRLMEAPAMEVVLLGVQPQSTDWGTELTPAVGAALGELQQAALQQVERWMGGQTVGIGSASGRLGTRAGEMPQGVTVITADV